VDWERAALRNLREILARLYPTERDSRRVVEDSGLDPAGIAFDSKADNNWFAILDEASKHAGKVDAIVAVARETYPDNDALKRSAAGAPPPPVTGPEPADWQGPKAAGQLERVIGTVSALVPISFLEVGLLKARSVAKIRRADASAGSGFIVADGILVTNNHVLPDAETARSSVAMFNYQLTVDGLSAEVDEHKLLPDAYFKTSEAEDCSAVPVDGEPNKRWGTLELAPHQVQVGDRVNIIQHPNGLPKQISLYSNVVVYTGGGRVQYLTDTEPGSSGAPVFDRDWNIVALHHSGGWIAEPGGADPSRKYYRNEGIHIDTVIAGLAS
jgi:V8-like Glu-specific endopeptidase